MRIALAYRRFGRGAAVPNYCLSLAKAFARGHETWAFTREIEGAPPGVRVVWFPLTFRSKRVEYSLNTVINSAILRFLSRGRQHDIVHTQDGELYGGGVVTAHSLLRVVHRVFRREDPDYVAWMPKNPLLWNESLIYRTQRYRHVIATSEKMRLALHEEYGVPQEDVTVVPLGIDPEVLRPDPSVRRAFRQAHGLPDDALVLLHVSTDFQRKGLATIIRALPLLSEQPVVAVVGKGNAEPFLKLAAKLGVTDRIVFLGYQPDIEMVYPGADAFLFPTKFDFFGYPVLEAMACGLPPFVSREAGIAEVIRDGRNGYLLSDPENAEELAERLRGSIGGSEMTTVGREARDTAKRLSVERLAAETLRVYEGLLRR